MNMFAENAASDMASYIANVPTKRKEAIEFMDELIKKTVPELEPHFASNMLGYGSFEYLDSKKKPQKWPIIALANQKNYISLYVCAVQENEYLAEKYKDELGKVNIGRSCIRFKKIEDLNTNGIKKVLKLAENYPGLVGAQSA